MLGNSYVKLDINGKIKRYGTRPESGQQENRTEYLQFCEE
jgi:hypothetical protein